jgi:pentatricopeptide repeat protein
MRKAGHELNAASYGIILQHHATVGNLTMCLRVLRDMKVAGVSPDVTAVEAVVTAACKERLPRLAYNLAVEYERETTRRFSLSTWTQLLASSANSYYVRNTRTRGTMN